MVTFILVFYICGLSTGHCPFRINFKHICTSLVLRVGKIDNIRLKLYCFVCFAGSPSLRRYHQVLLRMIKSVREVPTTIYYDSEDKVTSEQCCLRACHFCICSCMLFIGATVMLALSLTQPQMDSLRLPGIAVMTLSLILILVTGCVSMFVECRVQDKSAMCAQLHNVVCCSEDFPHQAVNLQHT